MNNETPTSENIWSHLYTTLHLPCTTESLGNLKYHPYLTTNFLSGFEFHLPFHLEQLLLNGMSVQDVILLRSLLVHIFNALQFSLYIWNRQQISGYHEWICICIFSYTSKESHCHIIYSYQLTTTCIYKIKTQSSFLYTWNVTWICCHHYIWTLLNAISLPCKLIFIVNDRLITALLLQTNSI